MFKEIILPLHANINVEECVRLRLSELLHFSPEHYWFSYKKNGDTAVVKYSTDSVESMNLIKVENSVARNKKTMIFLLILVVMFIANWFVLSLKKQRMVSLTLIRQIAKNEQYHWQHKLAVIKSVKNSNNAFLVRINDLIMQPLYINNLYVDKEKINLDAYIQEQDAQSFMEFLIAKGLEGFANFTKEGDKLWVSIRSS